MVFVDNYVKRVYTLIVIITIFRHSRLVLLCQADWIGMEGFRK